MNSETSITMNFRLSCGLLTILALSSSAGLAHESVRYRSAIKIPDVP